MAPEFTRALFVGMILALFATPCVSQPALANLGSESLSVAAAPARHPIQQPYRANLANLFFDAPQLDESQRHDLGELSPQERASLSEASRATKVGVVRRLSDPATFHRPDEATADRKNAEGFFENHGSFDVWTTSVASPGAHGLRVHLRAVEAPQGAEAFVYDAAGEVHGPYNLFEIDVDDGTWTNTVFSDEVFVEIQVPSNATRNPGFFVAVDAVAHLEHELLANGARTERQPMGFECIRDASCYSDSNWPWLSELSKAVAQLNYVKGGSAYICTGGLVNDSDDSSDIPYLLTANHCFATQAEANTLEAFWNYRTASCFGTIPNKASLPRTLGSTLLATGTASDFTFVRLPQLPSGAWLFGWSTLPLTAGSRIYRIGHPGDLPLIYSEEVVTASPLRVCSGVPVSNFVYSTRSVGTTGPGGSGGPASNVDGAIVGQLGGICGDALDDPCGSAINYIFDGRFSVTYPSIKQWLSPSSNNNPECTANTSTFCTQGKRFEVKISAKDPRSGKTDSGHVMLSSDFFGYFAFPVLAGNTTDPQVFVKVLDGRPVNGKIWVFYAALTDNEFTISIRDTTNGQVKTYYQAPYTQTSKNDTAAF